MNLKKGQEKKKEHNKQLETATRDLLGTTITFFAHELFTLMSLEFKIKRTLLDFPLKETLHSYGINVRYLGRVIRKMGSKLQFIDLLLLNMIARLVKNQFLGRIFLALAVLKVHRL